MATGDQLPVEQVDLSRLLELAVEDYTNGVLSASARFLLWGTIGDAGEIASSYLRARGHDRAADRRRGVASLTEEERLQRTRADYFADQLVEYKNWAKKTEGQPVLRECVVAHCSAYENCLKNIALVFRLASMKKRGLRDRVFVPSPQYQQTLRDIKADWTGISTADRCRANAFYDAHILEKNPDPEQYKFSSDLKSEWAVIAVAFAMRNSIVHQMGRPTEQLELDGTIFPAGWPLDLTTKHLFAIERAMGRVLEPFQLSLF